MVPRIIFCLLLVFVLVGCYRDNEEELAPCGIVAGKVHYSNVTALFTTYGCYGCHLGTAPEGGISLGQYSSVKALVDNGRLLGAITHAAGYAPMPNAAPKMAECDINRVKAWIDAGAPDD